MSVVVNGSNTPTAGGIGYGDGTNLAFSGAGTSGQFLSSGGSGAPTWVSAPSSAMTLISTLTANNTSPYLTWTNVGGYNNYLIVYNKIYSSTGTNGIRMQIGYGSTPTWITSYSMAFRVYYYDSGGTGQSGVQTNQSSLAIAGDVSGSVQSPGANGQVQITGAYTGNPVSIIGSSVCGSLSINYEADWIYGLTNPNSQITAFRIFMDSQSTNMQYGTASLYGISS